MSPTAILANEPVQTDKVATLKKPELGTRIQALSDDPVRRIWRGDADEKISLKRCPKFDSPYEEREWVKVRDKPYDIILRLLDLRESLFLGTYGSRLPVLG
jgi:hypothetical protein